MQPLSVLLILEGAGSPPPKPDVLTGIAAILAAIAWPVLVGTVLYLFREPLGQLLVAIVGIAASSGKVRIWQVEFDRTVQAQLDQSETSARETKTSYNIPEQQLGATIPVGEVQAANRVRNLLDKAPADTIRAEVLDSIRSRMLGFAQEYESTRASMPSGPDRTNAMNAVAAKMRTLALAADPFLDEFHADTGSPGKRLAAVCILQLAPNMNYVPWLAERMSVEHPFIFFHASVALLRAVRGYGAQHKDDLRQAIQKSLDTVNSYGELRDMNTVRTLTLALSELETV
jgi:hypothetical protein